MIMLASWSMARCGSRPPVMTTSALREPRVREDETSHSSSPYDRWLGLRWWGWHPGRSEDDARSRRARHDCAYGGDRSELSRCARHLATARGVDPGTVSECR